MLENIKSPQNLQSSFYLDKFSATAKKLRKIGCVAIPIITASVATYFCILPMYIALPCLEAISLKYLIQAFTCKNHNVETKKSMIIKALMINSLVLGSALLFLTFEVIKVALYSNPNFFLFIALACFLSTIWGFAGEPFYRNLELLFSDSFSKKLNDYLLAVQEGKLTFPTTATEFLFLLNFKKAAFFREGMNRYIYCNEFGKMSQSGYEFYSYIADEHDIKEHCDQLFKLLENKIKYYRYSLSNDDLNVISDAIQKIHILSGQFSEDLQVNMSLKILENLEKLYDCTPENVFQNNLLFDIIHILGADQQLNDAWKKIEDSLNIFLTSRAPALDIIREKFHHKLSQLPEITQRLAAINEKVEKFDENDLSECAEEIVALSKQFSIAQSELLELSRNEKFLTTNHILEEDKEIKESIKELLEKFTKTGKKFVLFNSKIDVQSEDSLDLEDSVWNMLFSRAGYKKACDELQEKLFKALNISTFEELDKKMTLIGLENVKDLLEKNIISKEEFKDKKLVESKVLEFIQDSKKDFKTNIRHLFLSTGKTLSEWQWSTVQTVAFNALLRMTMACFVLGPLLVFPTFSVYLLSSLAIVIGILTIKEKQVTRRKAMLENLATSQDGSFKKFLQFCARRSLFNLDFPATEWKKFEQAEFFGKLRVVSSELQNAILATIIAFFTVIPIAIMITTEMIETTVDLSNYTIKILKSRTA